MRAAVLLASVALAAAFSPHAVARAPAARRAAAAPARLPPSMAVRGGASSLPAKLATGAAAAVPTLAAGLAAGSRLTVPAVWAMALPCCALAFIRQAYVFSLGYGLSAAAVGYGVLASAGFRSAPLLVKLHAGGLLAYGARLFGFLWRRQQVGEGYKKKFKALDTKPRVERLPIVLSTSLFYALMMCPVAYLAASPVAAAAGVWNLKSKASIVSSVGLSLMYYGGFIEAFADYEKSVHKRNLTAGKGGKPWIATGEWRKSRHANYYGEIVFWFGTFLTGTPSFGKRVIPWVAGSLGFYGILTIMKGATKRLDKKQEEEYGSDAEWKEYVANTPSLWPNKLI